MPSETETLDVKQRKRGRPSTLTSFLHAKLVELARDGKIDREAAKIIGKDPSTLVRWKKKNDELRIAIKEAKALADEIVEASLFERATGYTKTYQTEKATKDGAVTVMETIHCPPDPTSMIFWLKNRKPDEWRDRKESTHEILIQKQEVLCKLSKEELVEATERLLFKLKNVPDPKLLEASAEVVSETKGDRL